MLKLSVQPALPQMDRKALSAFVQTLKTDRPNSIFVGSSFQYRGSTVTITKV